MKNFRSKNRQERGFTILEVIMGLAVISLIFGGIFSIAGGAMDLSKTSSQLREAEIRTTQFGQVLRNGFSQLSHRCEIEVKSETLRIMNPGQSLQWPGIPAGITETQIRLDKTAIAVFHYLGDVEAASLILVENVTSASWEVFEPISQQWFGVWLDEPDAKASLIRLRYTVQGESTFHEEVFRVPPFTSLEFKPPETINENENTN